MFNDSKSRDVQSPGTGRAVLVALWCAVLTGWSISVFTVIEEMCMVSACRDTAGFTIFGLNMGWFGIAYFSLLVMLLLVRRRDFRLNFLFAALVFSGVGAEFRLLWIQKFVIGGWCPLCVSICCALFVAALLMIVEQLRGARAGEGGAKSLTGWIVLMAVISAIGFATAVAGVRALS